ncbi:unnamed protein product [Mytilus edulis]|uniref:Reverse transcriptase zinc-binding domain-containing protein n=1 Tax=Mytilus edulis TaxID=6550 RepID=A0A8S3U8M3_MYTED|nr:unnamed protein product [Mytilus edulis]
MNSHFDKLDWEKIVRTSINSYWTSKLREDCNLKTTLNKLAFDIMEIGKTHNICDTISNSVKQVKQAVTKARMATGTYTLQIHKVKFNQSELDPTCPICRLEDETLLHVLTRCSAYNDIRKSQFQILKNLIISKIGQEKWKSQFINRQIICQLIIDCQCLVHAATMTYCQMTRNFFEQLK